MIIISFTFLGKQAKLEAEGLHAMNPKFNADPKLSEIRLMNNMLLDTEEDKFKEVYKWCKNYAEYSTKRKKREVLFAF